MGTNYYWRTAVCGGCGRYDELHVGKSGRMFEGHFRWDDGQPIPWITTWREWKTILTSGAGELWDEEGQRVDVSWFVDYVESTEPELRRRQYDAVAIVDVWHNGTQLATTGRVAPRCDWLCPDGFSFYGGEFT